MINSTLQLTLTVIDESETDFVSETAGDFKVGALELMRAAAIALSSSIELSL